MKKKLTLALAALALMASPLLAAQTLTDDEITELKKIATSDIVKWIADSKAAITPDKLGKLNASSAEQIEGLRLLNIVDDSPMYRLLKPNTAVPRQANFVWEKGNILHASGKNLSTRFKIGNESFLDAYGLMIGDYNHAFDGVYLGHHLYGGGYRWVNDKWVSDGSLYQGGDVMIGSGSSLTYGRSMSIGNNNKGYGLNAILVGHNVGVSGNYSIALGQNAITVGEGSIAHGRNSYALGDNSTVLGDQAYVQSQALRRVIAAKAKEQNIEPINGYELAKKSYEEQTTYVQLSVNQYYPRSFYDQVVKYLVKNIKSVSVGYSARVSGAMSAIVGADSVGSMSSSALGYKASAGNNAVAIGREAQTGYLDATFGDGAIAIGHKSQVREKMRTADYVKRYDGDLGRSIAIGKQATAYAVDNSELYAPIALGFFSRAEGFGSIALGSFSNDQHRGQDIVFGYNPETDKLWTLEEVQKLHPELVDLEADMKTKEAAMLALEQQYVAANKAKDPNLAKLATPVVQARYAYAQARNKYRGAMMGFASHNGDVSVGDAKNQMTRMITSVAPGSADTDAVNVGQLKSLVTMHNKLLKATGLTKEEVNAINEGNNGQAPKTLVQRIAEGKFDFSAGKGLAVTTEKGKVVYNLDLANSTEFKKLQDKVNTAVATSTAGWNLTVDGTTATVNSKQGLTLAGDDNVKVKLSAGEDAPSTVSLSLADDLKIKNSIQVGGAGGATMTKDQINLGGPAGTTLTKDKVNVGGADGSTLTKDGLTLGQTGPSLTKEGLDMQGKPITNVGEGTGENSVVTLKQVKTLINAGTGNAADSEAVAKALTSVRKEVSDALSEVRRTVSSGDAMNAAMSAMMPLDYDALRPTNFSVGIGAMGGQTAFALGMTHYTDRDHLFNVGASISDDKVGLRAGATFRVGPETESREVATDSALQRRVTELETLVKQLQAELATLKK